MFKKKSAICLLIVICLQTAFVVHGADEETEERDPGQMRINSDVISDTRQEIDQQSFIGFDVSPRLFLEDKREMEVTLTSSIQSQIDDARRIAFLTEHVSDRLDTSEVMETLFLEAEERTGRQQMNPIDRSIMTYIPTWLWVVIGLVGVGLLGYLGVLMGPLAARFIYKEKEREAEVNG